jgi:hypothetical protein
MYSGLARLARSRIWGSRLGVCSQESYRKLVDLTTYYERIIADRMSVLTLAKHRIRTARIVDSGDETLGSNLTMGHGSRRAGQALAATYYEDGRLVDPNGRMGATSRVHASQRENHLQRKWTKCSVEIMIVVFFAIVGTMRDKTASG